MQTFTISANIKNKYSCDTELSLEENKIFTDLGLKNYETGLNLSETVTYNKNVIANFDEETLNFFKSKVVEIIQNDYSDEELVDVCFETAVMSPTYFV